MYPKQEPAINEIVEQAITTKWQVRSSFINMLTSL